MTLLSTNFGHNQFDKQTLCMCYCEVKIIMFFSLVIFFVQFGGLLTAGILAFSGTCYTVAFLEDRKYSTLAPFGGFAFIAAWGSLFF